MTRVQDPLIGWGFQLILKPAARLHLSSSFVVYDT